jgi:hypothetical protein
MQSMSQFVFLHVGNDIGFPTLLVRSIRATNQDAVIYQCTDSDSPPIVGINHLLRVNGDTRNLMTFRLQAFSELGLTSPAIYLDTDMLVIAPIDVNTLLAGNDVALCQREFGREDTINISFKGMDLVEYQGKTFGEVYPYLACTTISKDNQFWVECRKNLFLLHEKFHFWYGDQEAIRNVSKSNRFKIKNLSEAKFACLPDKIDPRMKNIAIFHFKGPARKHLMVEYAKKMTLIAPHELR